MRRSSIVGANEVDVVVTDLAMPGMHGFELIDRIVVEPARSCR